MWSQEGDAVAQGCTVADAEPSARDQAFWGMERRRLKMTGAGQPCEGDMSGVVGGHWLRGSYFSFNSSAAKWLCGLGHIPCFCWIRGSIRSNPYIVNSTRWSSGTPGTWRGILAQPWVHQSQDSTATPVGTSFQPVSSPSVHKPCLWCQEQQQAARCFVTSPLSF